MTEEQGIRQSDALPGGQPGNTAAVRHGAHSERRIGPRAAIQKRKLLRQSGLRLRDVDALGRAFLQNWARAAAALAVMDEYAAEHGWLDADGKPRGFGALYVSLLNAERLAITKLGDYMRERHGLDPLLELEGEGRRIRLAAEEAEPSE